MPLGLCAGSCAVCLNVAVSYTVTRLSSREDTQACSPADAATRWGPRIEAVLKANSLEPIADLIAAQYATRPGNYLGLCGLSMPSGFSAGLPVGIQLVGREHEDAHLLDVASWAQGALA